MNRPKHARVANYMRDGAMRPDENGGSRDNYEPNSFAGPIQNAADALPDYPLFGPTTGRFEQKTERKDNYLQAGDLLSADPNRWPLFSIQIGILYS